MATSGSERDQQPRGFAPRDQGAHEDEHATDKSGGGAIDFGTFIMSLATSALIHMGELHEEGHEGPAQVNLPLAKETIDIIGMLRDKTRGNLTAEEMQTVESALYDLRLRFLKAKQRQPAR